ncbi:MAG: hypothetical protein HS128_17005 [Ideonella sp.]|nr:hypothetical protein [Ideonella sp.]MCC7456997.1 hypothetical protein [Nitrospira sp.]
MNHPLRCRCGRLQGHVTEPQRAMGRGICYCRDCRAYARFLGQPDAVLDAHGGTDVVAVQPQQVVIHQGHEVLACMSLSPRGLLRWYASCCRTPLGNTPRNPKVAYVGLVHNGLEGGGVSIESSFGPVTLHLNAASATSPVAERSRGALGSALRAMAAMAATRLSGRYRRSPFFDAASGAPVVAPQVLSRAERERLAAPP